MASLFWSRSPRAGAGSVDVGSEAGGSVGVGSGAGGSVEVGSEAGGSVDAEPRESTTLSIY